MQFFAIENGTGKHSLKEAVQETLYPGLKVMIQDMPYPGAGLLKNSKHTTIVNLIAIRLSSKRVFSTRVLSI